MVVQTDNNVVCDISRMGNNANRMEMYNEFELPVGHQQQRHYKFFLLLFTLFTLPLSAQQTVTVQLTDRPMVELFRAIEQQTEYRIFCAAEVSDSLKVSVNETNAEPVTLIQRALRNTGFQTSVYKNRVYIIKDRTLVTALPESFYGKAPTRADNVSLIFERETKATSESLIYAVGNPNTPSTTNVVMTGVVTNFKNGEPVPGVNLLLEDPPVGAATDASGLFTIRLPAGRHELIIRGIGVKDTKRQLMLFSDGKLDIELEEEIYTLSEVSIMGERADNIRSVSGGMERLQMRAIKNIPTVLGEADILRIIMTLPGVKSTGEVASGFNVRGGATDQNLILFNDGTIYMPAHLFGLFSAFNPDVVDNMELYKSGIPAKYGGRLSSVLEINSKEGNREKLQGSASIGLLTSRLTLDAPLFKGKGSFIVGGRTTYSDWLMDMIPEKSGYDNGRAGFYDLNASANYKIDERNSVSVTGYFSRDRFNFTHRDQYAYQNTNFSAKWRHIFNHRLTSATVVGYDYYRHSTRDTTDIFNAYSLEFSINQVFGKADFTYYLNKSHTLNAGASTMMYRMNPGNFEPALPTSLVRNDKLQTEKALESALYLSDQWEISPEWMVSAGIRYSMFNVLGPRVYNVYSPDHFPSPETILRTDTVGTGLLKTYHGPEFRFSIRYIINENTSLKAGVNSMRQNIHMISNSTAMSPTDTWKLSDMNIVPQNGVQYVAGLFRNFAGNTVETSVETYYKTMRNYLDYRVGAQLLMNPNLEMEAAGVKGRAYGVELMIKKGQGRMNGWVSYVYSRTMLRRHEGLASSANSAEWYPADFDKPHEVKFVGNFKLTNRYSFSLNCDYSTGRPITVPVSKYWYDGQQYVFFSERNNIRIPDFFRIDVSFNVEAGHHLTKMTHGYFNIGVYNITGRKNAYSVYYVWEGLRVQGYKMSIFGVPIPYVSYNMKF